MRLGSRQARPPALSSARGASSRQPRPFQAAAPASGSNRWVAAAAADMDAKPAGPRARDSLVQDAIVWASQHGLVVGLGEPPPPP